jgi:hypothetical protein
MTEEQILRVALQRIVDWSDCQCEHESDDCCANCDDRDFHCPGCIAARALAAAPGRKCVECGEPTGDDRYDFCEACDV